MKKNKIKALWRADKPVLNGWLSIASSFTAEIMAAQGYDSLTVDLQHGALDYQSALSMFQAMRASEIGLSDTSGRLLTSPDRKLPPRCGVAWISGAPDSTVTLCVSEPSSSEKFSAMTS